MRNRRHFTVKEISRVVSYSFGRYSGECIPTLVNYEDVLYNIKDKIELYKDGYKPTTEELLAIYKVDKVLEEEGYYELYDSRSENGIHKNKQGGKRRY